MVEMIDVLDKSGNFIATVSRQEAENKNHTTINALIFIFNSDGKLWVQLRPKTKNHYPGLWDISACGGLLSGEVPEKAARRETLEETGITLNLEHVESFLNIMPGDSGEERRRLSHLYVGITDKKPKASKEVDEFKLWAVKDLVKELIAQPKLFVPSFLFELKKAVAGYNNLVNKT